MIALAAKLVIRSITGRNGRFNVGRLITDIGEFTVKDELFEEFDEGTYRGQFNVAQVYPASYVANSRMVVEVRARVVSFTIDEGEAGAVDEQMEKDPLDEQTPAPALTPADAPATTTAEASVEPAPATPAEPVSGADVEGDDAELSALFGTLWPLGDVVQLDPTVGRDKFRNQRDALKERGYRFEPKEQKWVRSMGN